MLLVLSGNGRSNHGQSGILSGYLGGYLSRPGRQTYQTASMAQLDLAARLPRCPRC